MKILKKINNLLEAIMGIGIGLIMILVVIQVFFRYILEMPLIGPDALTRFTVIWVVLLGFAVLVRSNKHISVTYFRELLNDQIQKILRIIGHLIVASFSVIMLYYGFDLSLKAMIQITPETGIRMGYVDLAVPLAGLFGLMFTIENIVNEVKNQGTEVNY